MSAPNTDAFEGGQAENGAAVAASSRRRRWFRLMVKSVVTLSCIGVVVGALLYRPVTQAREAARRSSCKCRLKQFGLAFHNYHDVYGSFPPAIVFGPNGSSWHSWRVLILPYLECQPIYDKYRFDEPWDGPNNRKLLDEMPEIFSCPSRPNVVKASLFGSLSCSLLACSGHAPSTSSGYTSYAAPVGLDCIFRGPQTTTTKEMKDGTSNTFLIGECTGTRIPWTKPEDIDIAFHSRIGDRDGFSSSHESGAHFLMADGTVRFVGTTIAQSVIDGLFTRSGGETISDF